MKFHTRNLSSTNALLIAGIILFAVAFVISPGLNFPSDENLFFRTLLSGKFFYQYDARLWDYFDPIKVGGRLEPMVGVPYNIVLLLAKLPTAFHLFLVQALLYLIFVVVTFKTLISLRVTITVALGALLFISLIPASTFSWYRLLMAESTLVFYLALLVFFYARYQSSGDKRFYFLTLLACTLAVLSKSSAFVIVLTFAAYNLVLLLTSYYQHRADGLVAKTPISLNLVLVVICITYYVAFRIIVGEPGVNVGLRLKDWWQLTSATDPAITYLIIPLGLILPLAQLAGRPKGLTSVGSPISMGLLFTAAIYAIFLIAIGKHSEYYTLPSYYFAMYFACEYISRGGSVRTSTTIKWQHATKSEYFHLALVFLCYIAYINLRGVLDVRTYISVLLLVATFYHIYRVIWHENLTQPTKLSALASSISVVLLAASLYHYVLPGIGNIVFFKADATNLQKTMAFLGNQIDKNNDVQILNTAGVAARCSIVHDFYFNEILAFHRPDSNYKFVIPPYYQAQDCKTSAKDSKNWCGKSCPSSLTNYADGVYSDPDLILIHHAADSRWLGVVMNHIERRETKISYVMEANNKVVQRFLNWLPKVSAFSKEYPTYVVMVVAHGGAQGIQLLLVRKSLKDKRLAQRMSDSD